MILFFVSFANSLLKSSSNCCPAFDENFDIPSISRFVLGKYWKSATTTQKKEFILNLIKSLFKIKDIIEEDNDIIVICYK